MEPSIVLMTIRARSCQQGRPVLTSMSAVSRGGGGPGDAERQRQKAAAGQQYAGDQGPPAQHRTAKGGDFLVRHRPPTEKGIVHKEAGGLAAKRCKPRHW